MNNNEQKEQPELGATGKFPEGKPLNEYDQGGINVGITVDQGKIIVAFGKSVSWIGMTPNEAIEFAAFLIAKARGINAKKKEGE